MGSLARYNRTPLLSARNGGRVRSIHSLILSSLLLFLRINFNFLVFGGLAFLHSEVVSVLFTRRAWRCLMLLAEYESISMGHSELYTQVGCRSFRDYSAHIICFLCIRNILAWHECPFMIPLHCVFTVSRPQGFSV
jgi:hypothetical protein